MPRPSFPHSLHDVLHAVDGPFGLVVGDVPDGSIWVLRRGRREPGYTLTHYADGSRSTVLHSSVVVERRDAVNLFADAIALGERL